MGVVGEVEVRLEVDGRPFARAMLELAAAMEGLAVVTSSAAEAARTYNATVRWLRRHGNRWWRLERARIHPNARRRPKRARRRPSARALQRRRR